METSDNTNNHKPFYWIILSVLFIFSLVTGFFGFQNFFIQHGENHSFLRSLYRAIQLFTLEGGDINEPVPLALQVARFTSPLTTLIAVIMTLLEIFNEQWKRMKIAMMKNHVVIIGFGTKGKNILLESLSKKGKVLIIENDPDNPNLALAQLHGCRILKSDATDKNTLIKARIHKAKKVYLLMGDDNKQIAACLHIYSIIKESKRDEHNPLICYLHLQKQEFLNTMRNHKLVQDIHDGLLIKIFNIYENSARELFAEDPPDQSGITSHSPHFVRIIIFGFGKAGEALALQTAFSGHYLNGKKPSVVIIDKLAKNKIVDFQERYPSYTDFCDIEYLALDANSPQLIYRITKYLKNEEAYTTVCLCFDNKAQNLLLGLQLENLQQNKKGMSFQLFARTDDNSSFDAISEKIKPYGLPSIVCSIEASGTVELDKQAKAFHDNYLEGKRGEKDFGKRLAHSEWENLSGELKDSNRKVAIHAAVKIRGIGCKIVSLSDSRPPASFTADEIEELSKVEHSRWRAERSLSGWTLGDEENDNTRTSPHLIDWDKLSEEVKEYDRTQVRAIPDALRKASSKFVRK